MFYILLCNNVLYFFRVCLVFVCVKNFDSYEELLQRSFEAQINDIIFKRDRGKASVFIYRHCRWQRERASWLRSDLWLEALHPKTT